MMRVSWLVGLIVCAMSACATQFAVEQQVELKSFLDTEVREFADDYLEIGRNVKNPYFLRPKAGFDAESNATLEVYPPREDRPVDVDADPSEVYASQRRILGMPLALTSELNLNFNLFRYATFCGPGWPDGLQPPTGDDPQADQNKRIENAKTLRRIYNEKGAFDDIDHACFAHDMCYETIGRNTETCDFAMMATMLALASQFRDRANLATALENTTEQEDAMECANLTVDMALAFFVKPRQANLLDFVVAFSRMYATYDQLSGDTGEGFLRLKFQEQAAFGFPVGNDRCQALPGADTASVSGQRAIALFENFVNGDSLNIEAFAATGASPIVETAAASGDAAEDERSLFDPRRFQAGVEQLGRRAVVRAMMAAERTGCVGRDCGPARFDICLRSDLAESDAGKGDDDAVDAEDTPPAAEGEAAPGGCAALDVEAVQSDWTRVNRRMWRVAAIEVGEYLARAQ